MNIMKCPVCEKEYTGDTMICPYCNVSLIHQQQMTLPRQSSGLAIASMVLGIVSLLLICFIIGIIPGIVGLVLGIVSLAQNKSGKGMAIAGIITSTLTIIFVVLLLLLGISASSQYENESTIQYSNTNSIT